MNNLEEYVDLDQLEVWKSILENYNEQCLNYLDEFVRLSLELQTIWTGEAASGFDENFSSQLKQAQEHHTELKDVTEFLRTFAETLKNE